jgi:hypothetical protein
MASSFANLLPTYGKEEGWRKVNGLGVKQMKGKLGL